MTYDEKMYFVAELIHNVRDAVLSQVPNMPEEWDGHELRRYIADKFEDANMGCLARGRVRHQHATKRLAAYRNEVITRNL